MRYRLIVITLAGLAVAVTGGNVALADGGGPTIERDRFEERFFDDFIFELCGIETFTTLTQQSSVMAFPDGSQQIHVVRTYVPDDPRIPIEKGAATAFYSPDGTQTVIGKPLQLFGPDGGVQLIGAGWVRFLDEPESHGLYPAEALEDPAPYYCPTGT